MNVLELLLKLVLSSELSSSDDGKCGHDQPWKCPLPGTLPDPSTDISRKENIIKWWYHEISEDAKLPENFDAREHWPHCEATISKIKNQGGCNTCWAHCAAMVHDDRVCIQSEGKIQMDHSVLNLVSCCADCQVPNDTISRCEIGGIIRLAMEYITENGLTSTNCQPYNITKLRGIYGPTCERKCDDPDSVDYREEKFYKGRFVFLAPREIDEEQIKMEILENGPVCAAVANNTEVFIKWKGVGVIVPPDPLLLSNDTLGHAVRILGWGNENGIPYWLGANTWGTNWGLKGFFKIKRDTEAWDMDRYFVTILTDPLHVDDNPTTPSKRREHKDLADVVRLGRFNFVVIIAYFLVDYSL